MLGTALHKATSEFNETDSWTCVGGVFVVGWCKWRQKVELGKLLQHCRGVDFPLGFVCMFNLEAKFKVRYFYFPCLR